MNGTPEHTRRPSGTPDAPDAPPHGRRIYLDSAASAPLRSEALDAMMPYLTSAYANPSAHHDAGRDASDALEDAREEVAAILNASPEEVVFTSGGTESINAAIKGVAMAQSEADRKCTRLNSSP